MKSESRSVVSDFLQPHGLYSSWNSPGQNTGMGSLCLLQGIFPTQGLNSGLLHCRRILYQLSHKQEINSIPSYSFMVWSDVWVSQKFESSIIFLILCKHVLSSSIQIQIILSEWILFPPYHRDHSPVPWFSCSSFLSFFTYHTVRITRQTSIQMYTLWMLAPKVKLGT